MSTPKLTLEQARLLRDRFISEFCDGLWPRDPKESPPPATLEELYQQSWERAIQPSRIQQFDQSLENKQLTFPRFDILLMSSNRTQNPNLMK